MWWNKKQKRAYHRIRAGLYRHRKEKLRFLTFTSAPDMDREIRDAFNIMYKRMKRVKPIDFLEHNVKNPDDGFYTKSQLRYYYGRDERKWNEPLCSIEYFKVETTEGVSGVFHILYFGSYYPQWWLSSQWLEITGTAFQVDVRKIKQSMYDIDNLSAYCVNQYVAGQEQFLRYYFTRNWCIKGFIKVWSQCKRNAKKIRAKPVRIGEFEQKYTWDKAKALNFFYDWIDHMLHKRKQVKLDEFT